VDVRNEAAPTKGSHHDSQLAERNGGELTEEHAGRVGQVDGTGDAAAAVATCNEAVSVHSDEEAAARGAGASGPGVL
jgi:hypothetical protein